jgi:Tfp pilus assembly protein PilF
MWRTGGPQGRLMIQLCRAACVLLFFLLPSVPVRAQSDAATVYHEIEGHVQFSRGRAANIRVRLLRMPETQPVAETFTRAEGQFRFTQVTEGEYAVETLETDRFEAALQSVAVRPVPRNMPTTFRVVIELSEKAADKAGAKYAPGVSMADVDAGVPQKAVEHYLAGMKSLRNSDSDRAISEFKKAVNAHPPYYAARLAAGRELRRRGKLEEAAEFLRPLRDTAPRKAEPRIEYALVLLALGKRDDAVAELKVAASLPAAGWEAHYYLGWALLETRAGDAETHLRRALELDEARAARAHLALARLANERGQRAGAIAHLESFLTLSPDSQEAESARALADKLRAERRNDER